MAMPQRGGRRRYLTKTQKAVLKCMAENGGRAVIGWGVRWSEYYPGHARIFGQAFPTILHNRWITNRGQNDRSTYVWTDEGKLAHDRGWYIPVVRNPYWLDEKPLPAGSEMPS